MGCHSPISADSRHLGGYAPSNGVRLYRTRSARSYYLHYRTGRLAAINACGYSEQDKANLRDKLTWIGMTAEQARLANGEPDRIDRSVTAAGVCERWVYGADLRQPTYLYITDGKVSGWHE